jgi:hypothetical protein
MGGAAFFANGAIDGGNVRRRFGQLRRERQMTTVRKLKGFRKRSSRRSFMDFTIATAVSEGHASSQKLDSRQHGRDTCSLWR